MIDRLYFYDIPEDAVAWREEKIYIYIKPWSTNKINTSGKKEQDGGSHKTGTFTNNSNHELPGFGTLGAGGSLEKKL